MESSDRGSGTSRERLSTACQNLAAAMDASLDMAAIVDQEGLVVYANRAFTEAFGKTIPDGLLGKRIGAIANCSRFLSTPAGCGKGIACAFCGVNRAILQCLTTGQVVAGEASLVLNSKESLVGRNFEVKATPLTADGPKMAIVSIRDISAQKIQRFINSQFILYLVENVGIIHSLSRFIADCADANQHRDLTAGIVDASDQVLGRLRQYEQLVNAESGEVHPKQNDIAIKDLVTSLEQQVAKDLSQPLVVDCRCSDQTVIVSDANLLLESLLSMVHCATKSSNDDRGLYLRISLSGGDVHFCLHSHSLLSSERKYAFYSRWHESDSYAPQSLCAYIARLHVERYLGGEIGCRSSGSFGTAFYLSLPQDGKASADAHAA